MPVKLKYFPLKTENLSLNYIEIMTWGQIGSMHHIHMYIALYILIHKDSHVQKK